MPGDSTPETDAAYASHHRLRNERTIEVASEFLRPGGTVASVGVSPFDGDFARRFGAGQFACLVPDGRFVADQPESIRNSRRFVYFDLLGGGPPPEVAFDLVVMAEVLEHLLGDDREILSRLRTVLRPGGVLVLTVPNFVRHVHRAKVLLGVNPLAEKASISRGVYGGLGHVREYSGREVRELLSRGFRLLRLTGMNPYGSRFQRALLDLLPRTWASAVVAVAMRER